MAALARPGHLCHFLSLDEEHNLAREIGGTDILSRVQSLLKAPESLSSPGNNYDVDPNYAGKICSY